MASIHAQRNRNTTTYRVLWRDDGRQRSLTFVDMPAAQHFKTLLDSHGSDEAIRAIQAEEHTRATVTVNEWLKTYIDGLTGVQPATINRYCRYADNDVGPVFGDLPITAVTETTIAKWVQGLEAAEKAGKTIANKHGFLSAAFNTAVRAGLIDSNPCEGRRLPHTLRDEMVFLTPAEFTLLRDCIPHQRWKDLATWLVLTGMRFSEATALTPADIDVRNRTCRIWRSWKYATHRNELKLGPPKTQKSNRTISLPQAALDVIDLTAPEWLFTNASGNPVRAQEFWAGGWKPGREKARELGLTKAVRPHDLRHTCASWMIAAAIPLPVVQAHLGHESINTTISSYFHTDQRQGRLAADAVGNLLSNAALPALDRP